VVEISERVALDAAADAGGADAGAADAGGADDTGIGGAEATKPHHVAAPPRVLTGVAFPATKRISAAASNRSDYLDLVDAEESRIESR